MTIKTYSDLQTAVANEINRQDCAVQIPDWIECTRMQLEEYVGPLAELINPDDTNSLLDYDPYVFLWGAVSQAADYLRDADMKELYETKYQARLNDLSMTGFTRLKSSPNTFIPTPLYRGWYRRRK